MEVTIAPNKLCSEEQKLDFTNQKVYTLIGQNGAGKSSILESIFEKYIDNDDVKIICFSSGQNELFSDLFDKYKSRSKRFLKEEDPQINSFYFYYDWVRILVFFASILRPEGNVRNYLKSKGYINVDENTNDDVSSKYSIRFRVRKSYSWKISREIDSEAKAENVKLEKLLRKSDYHSTLESIITSFNIDFDFFDEDYLVKRWITFDAQKAFEIFTHKDINRIFTFWALASHGYESNIDIDESDLKFNNNLEFKQLSDGEYQLLSIYALVDLFDSEKTVFLFDEIDSHLYYQNIGKLWTLLNTGIKGNVVTTTHLSESILKNNYNGLKYIEKGKVEGDLILRELAMRMAEVVGISKYELQLVKKVETVALIDDEVDWKIFKKLAEKKIGIEVNEFLGAIVPFKRSSGFNAPTDTFGMAKLKFVKEFKEQTGNSQKITRKFLLICDRDRLMANHIDNECRVQIHNDYRDLKAFDGVETKLFSWKRLEIENYLLSYTMLQAKGKLAELQNQFPHINFTVGSNMDGIADIAEYDCKAILHPLYKQTGFNEQSLDEIIDLIPANEISNDIVIMYNSIKSEVV